MKPTKLVLLLMLILSFYSDNDQKQMGLLATNPQNAKSFKASIECTQTIFGKITTQDNIPIPNALVTLYVNGEEIKLAKVNAKGEYSFKINCNTNYKISVRASTFFNAIYKFKTSTKKGEKISYNFSLNKECYQTITGTVTNELTKKIVDGATVELYLDGEKIGSLKVDNNGKYSFKIKCNTHYYIIVSKLNYINDLFEFSTSKSNAKNINHEVMLEPECVQTISGTILNKATKEPISAQLTLFLNNIEVETIQINNDGKYAIKFQCTTNYKIIASKPNYKNDSYYFLTDYIEDQQSDYFHLKKDLFLEPNVCYQVVLGKVLEKNSDKIIPNATVSLFYENHEIKTFQTNNDGSYFFTIKCNLNYEIKAFKNEMISEAVSYKASSVKNDTKTKNVYLREEICNQIVEGTVIDKNTKLPLANIKITLFEANKEINNVLTTNNGAFSIPVSCKNTYKIVANNTEYNTASVLFETTKNRNETVVKTIELIPLDCNQIVEGTVVDKNTKLPLANTKITLFEANKEINSVLTTNNGAFSIPVSCKNTYKIVANNTKYNTASVLFETTKNRNETVVKTIELIPLDCKQTVEGTVVDKNTKLPLANTKITLFEANKEINSVLTTNNGAFSIPISCKNTYKIVANNEQYTIKTTSFTTNSIRNSKNSIKIELSKKICNQTVTGIIRDKVTKKPLPNTTISLYQNNEVVETYTVGENGVYVFQLECLSKYKLTVFKNNRLESFKFKTVTQHNRVLTLHINIEPLVCIQYINGVVVENISNNPIPNAKVALFNNSNKIKQAITNSNGTFYFEIECDKIYTISSEKINYTATQQQLISSTKSAFSHTIEMVLEPIIQFKEKNGIKYIETKPIVFELDEYEIINEAKKELNKVVYNMNQNPKIKIEINYHTDSRGPDAYNLKLTINRANATKDYLISKGINVSRIKANGYGETRLLNKCKNNVKCSDAEHAINRRTEFIAISN